jgi:hypothetical protein
MSDTGSTAHPDEAEKQISLETVWPGAMLWF